MAQKQIRIALTMMVDDDEAADELLAELVGRAHDCLGDADGEIPGGYTAEMSVVSKPA